MRQTINLKKSEESEESNIHDVKSVSEWASIWDSLVKKVPALSRGGNILGIIHNYYTTNNDNFAFPQTPADEKLGSKFDFFRRDPIAAAYSKDTKAVDEFKSRINAGKDLNDLHNNGYDISSLAMAWFFDEEKPLPIERLATILNYAYALNYLKDNMEIIIENDYPGFSLEKPTICHLIDEQGNFTRDAERLFKRLKTISNDPLPQIVLENFKNRVLNLPPFEQAFFYFPHLYNAKFKDDKYYAIETGLCGNERDEHISFPSDGIFNAYLQAVYGENAVISTLVLGPLSKEDIESSGRANCRYKNVFTKNSKTNIKVHEIINPSFLLADFHDAAHALLMSIISMGNRAFIWLMLDKIRLLSQKWSRESWYLVDFILGEELYSTNNFKTDIEQLQFIFKEGSLELPYGSGIPPALSVLAYALVTPEELKKIGMDYQTFTTKVYDELSIPQFRDLKKLIESGQLCFGKNKMNKLVLVDRGDKVEKIVNLGKWEELVKQVPALHQFGLMGHSKMQFRSTSSSSPNISKHGMSDSI